MFRNKLLSKGTIVIYTAITNTFIKIQNVAKRILNFVGFYDKMHQHARKVQPLILPCSPFVSEWLCFSLQIRCIFCAFPIVTEISREKVQKLR